MSHLSFVITSYSLAAIGIIGLIATLVIKERYLQRAIANLEKSGIHPRARKTAQLSGNPVIEKQQNHAGIPVKRDTVP